MAIQKTPNYDSCSYSQLVEKRDLFMNEFDSVEDEYNNYMEQSRAIGEISDNGETEIVSINCQANALRYAKRLSQLSICIFDLNNRIAQQLPGVNSLATTNPAISPIRSDINSFSPAANPSIPVMSPGINSFDPYDSYNSQLVEKVTLLRKEALNVNIEFTNYLKQNSNNGEIKIFSFACKANMRRYHERLCQLQNCIDDLNRRIVGKKLPEVNSLTTANPTISPIKSGINSLSPAANPSISVMSPGINAFNPTVNPSIPVMSPGINSFSPAAKSSISVMSPGINAFNPTVNPRIPVMSPGINSFSPAAKSSIPVMSPGINAFNPTVNPSISVMSPGINSFSPAANPSISVMSPGTNSFSPAAKSSISVMSPGIKSFNPTVNPSVSVMSPGINSTADVFNSKIETYIDTKIEAYFKQRGSATSMTNTELPDTRGSDSLNSKIETLINSKIETLVNSKIETLINSKIETLVNSKIEALANSKIEAIFNQRVPEILAAYSSQNNNSNPNNFSFDNEYMNISDVNDDFQ